MAVANRDDKLVGCLGKVRRSGEADLHSRYPPRQGEPQPPREPQGARGDPLMPDPRHANSTTSACANGEAAAGGRVALGGKPRKGGEGEGGEGDGSGTGTTVILAGAGTLVLTVTTVILAGGGLGLTVTTVSGGEGGGGEGGGGAAARTAVARMRRAGKGSGTGSHCRVRVRSSVWDSTDPHVCVVCGLCSTGWSYPKDAVHTSVSMRSAASAVVPGARSMTTPSCCMLWTACPHSCAHRILVVLLWASASCRQYSQVFDLSKF